MSKPASRYSIENFLYIHSDEDLIVIAGRILGNGKLRLSLREAVDVIRENYTQVV